jgi:hypothetical protein
MSSEFNGLFSAPTVAITIPTVTTRTNVPLTLVPGVSFTLLPRSPRSLLLSTGTNRFQVLLDYSTPPLRQFLREARQAHHDIIEVRNQRDINAREVMRLRRTHPDPDNDLFVPQRPTTPPPVTLPLPDPIIADDHPQLTELRNERDSALHDLASITTELTLATTRIETLTARVQQLEESMITPSASASQVNAEVTTSPSVTDPQLRTLARLTRLATEASVESGHSRIHRNHSPTGHYLYVTYVWLARLRLSRTDHQLHPHDAMAFTPHIQTQPDLSEVPRTRARSAEMTLVNHIASHSNTGLTEIAEEQEHTCVESAPCLFSYLQSNYDVISQLPATGVIAMFYSHIATDVMNIRRYNATALQLISYVSDPTVIGTLADIATRRPRSRLES